MSAKFVVIAEDDPAIADLVQEVLRERLAVDTAVVANGALVTDAIAQRRTDLLILDLTLPGLSGLDVFDLVRGSPAHQGVPVLILTADPEHARSAAGHAPVIGKPFDVDALVRTIAEIIGTASVAA